MRKKREKKLNVEEEIMAGYTLRNILRLLEWAITAGRIARTEIVHHPVFILGYYRSGTTYLITLFSKDPNRGYVSNVEGYLPTIFLEFPRLSLLLIDIDFGVGIDGIDAVKAIAEHKRLPVVFLTCHTEKEYVNRIEKVSAYGLVGKNAGEYVLLYPTTTERRSGSCCSSSGPGEFGEPLRPAAGSGEFGGPLQPAAMGRKAPPAQTALRRSLALHESPVISAYRPQ